MRTIQTLNVGRLTGIASALLAGILFLTTGCKKVSHNDEFLQTIYSVLTESSLYKTDGASFYYQYAASTGARVPGDTLTIAGILGGNNAQRVVKIGDSTVAIFGNTQYRIYDLSTKDTLWTTIDYFKCRIPKGINGNTVPVTITVNGMPVSAPVVKIQQYTDIVSATDITLIVEKILEWLPENMNAYKAGTSTLLDLWEDGTVTSKGNCWFYNQPEGIFKIANGSVQRILGPGAQITPASGNPFGIIQIIGFTIDIDETALYFSAFTTEKTADTASYYITRLCRMDPASGKVEVLNRSLVMKRASQYPRAADLVTPLYDPSVNYVPAEGDIADVRMALVNLHLSLDGTLFAVNNIYNTAITPKSPLAGHPKFPQFSDPAYYARTDSLRASSWYITGGRNASMENFVRIRDGKLRSLAKPNASRPVPAIAVYYYANKQLSPDGKYIYEVDQLQRTLIATSTEDFESETLGVPNPGDFSFSSLDTTLATGLHTPAIQLEQDRFANYYVLSNRDVVFFPSSYNGISLLAINFSKHNAYAYAGTEKGLNFRDPADVPGQDRTAGLAKWVNFSPNRRVLYGKNLFIGFDRQNNLYYASFATQGFGANHLLMEIYRIRKP